MKKDRLLIALLVIVVLVGVFYLIWRATNEVTPNSNSVTNEPMEIRSLAFGHNESVPAQYTCDGEDVNPALIFADVPDSAQSLALIVHDPDAPKSGGWTHWVVFNMPPNVGRIPENAPPAKGVEGLTDFGTTGYGGPCPPSGTHRYFFNAYALDTMLDLDESATKDDVEDAMKGHIVAEAELIGLYQRQ